MSFECVEEYTSWSIKIAFKLWIYLLPLIWLYLSVWSMASIFLQTEADGFRYVVGGVGVVMILITASWVVLH
ncbi:hypothetical protein HC256_010257 [Beauveria bassiana]|nr:hypothetical protein HC256_010257 [Beauveria bassiana]